LVEASEDDDFIAVVDGLMIGSTLRNSSVGGYAVDLINRALNLGYLRLLHVDQIHGVQEAAVVKSSEDVDVVAYHIHGVALDSGEVEAFLQLLAPGEGLRVEVGLELGDLLHDFNNVVVAPQLVVAAHQVAVDHPHVVDDELEPKLGRIPVDAGVQTHVELALVKRDFGLPVVPAALDAQVLARELGFYFHAVAVLRDRVDGLVLRVTDLFVDLVDRGEDLDHVVVSAVGVQLSLFVGVVAPSLVHHVLVAVDARLDLHEGLEEVGVVGHGLHPLVNLVLRPFADQEAVLAAVLPKLRALTRRSAACAWCRSASGRTGCTLYTSAKYWIP